MIHIQQYAPALDEPNILWDSLFAKGAVSASSALPDGSGLNAVGGGTADGWIPATMPASLSVTLAAPAWADAAAIAAHTLGSTGCTIYIDHFAAGAWVQSAAHVPTDDSTIVMFFPRAQSDQWRIRVEGLAAPYIGYAIITERLVIPGGIVAGDHVPLNLCQEVDMLDDGFMRNGQHTVAQIERIGGRTDIQIMPQDPDYVLGPFEPFRQHFNRGKGFVFCAAPVVWPENFGYCWRDGREIMPVQASYHFFTIDMGVRVYVP